MRMPPSTWCPWVARRPCRMTATTAAAAPARIINLRGRTITPPLGIQRPWLGHGIPHPGGFAPGLVRSGAVGCWVCPCDRRQLAERESLQLAYEHRALLVLRCP